MFTRRSLSRRCQSRRKTSCTADPGLVDGCTRHLVASDGGDVAIQHNQVGRRPPTTNVPASSSKAWNALPCCIGIDCLHDRDSLLGDPAINRLALRVAAQSPPTARPSSGRCDETGQSEPKLTRAPRLARVAMGYCSELRSGPRHGSVRSSCEASEAGPQWLEVGDHAERGEPRPILRMNELGVGDDGSTIPSGRSAARHVRSHRARSARRHHRSRGCGSGTHRHRTYAPLL